MNHNSDPDPWFRAKIGPRGKTNGYWDARYCLLWNLCLTRTYSLCFIETLVGHNINILRSSAQEAWRPHSWWRLRSVLVILTIVRKLRPPSATSTPLLLSEQKNREWFLKIKVSAASHFNTFLLLNFDLYSQITHTHAWLIGHACNIVSVFLLFEFPFL